MATVKARTSRSRRPGMLNWSPLTKEEICDPLRDDAGPGLKRKVSCVDEQHLGIGLIALESSSTRWKEERIPLTPDREHRRPVLTEVLLPNWIERNIAAIVVNQIELYLLL